MDKEQCLRELTDTGVVAVIRTRSGDELVNVCQALADGGIKGVEITMTSPGAIEAIYQASKILKGKAIIGAGSVLDPETARSGADIEHSRARGRARDLYHSIQHIVVASVHVQVCPHHVIVSVSPRIRVEVPYLLVRLVACIISRQTRDLLVLSAS